MTTLEGTGAKRSYTGIRFSFGIDPIFVRGYTDNDLGFAEDGVNYVTVMDYEINPINNSGGFPTEPVGINLPSDLPVVRNLISPEPFAIVYCRITEYLTDETTTETDVLYEGVVTRAFGNYQGKPNRAFLEISDDKMLMERGLGVTVSHL